MVATDINNLYQSLLLTIRNLELEKEKVSLAEKEKNHTASSFHRRNDT